MSASNAAFDTKQKNLIEDAARWRLIGLLFECPASGWHDTMTALASTLPDSDLKEAVSAAQSEASEGSYHSLFGPGGPASPREASYHRGVELGSLMSELTGYYEAFGYSPSSHESYDHVAVEADFVGYLRLKEAYAQACRDSKHAEVTAEAARHFIGKHLSTIARPLLTSLGRSGVQYLLLAGQALEKHIKKIGSPDDGPNTP